MDQTLTYKRSKILINAGQTLKDGLQPEEFERLLQNKLEELMKSTELNWVTKDQENCSTKQKLDKYLENAKKVCARKICLRIDEQNPDFLASDQSTESLYLYNQVASHSLNPNTPIGKMTTTDDLSGEPVDLSLLPSGNLESNLKILEQPEPDVATANEYYSPPMLQRLTSKQQGTTKHSIVSGRIYHKEQERLLDNLLPYFMKKMSALKDMPQFDKKNISPDSSNETENFCIEIDFYAFNLIHLCAKLILFPELVPEQDCIKFLSEILIICEWIVMGRNIVDWEITNDLSKDSDKKKWIAHVKVLVSFASLLTALIMLIKICKDIDDKWYADFIQQLEALKGGDIENDKASRLIIGMLKTINQLYGIV